MTLPNVFKHIMTSTSCGFAANKNEGKEEKVIYHTKIITGRLNSIVGNAPDHMKVDTYGKPYLHTFYALISD